MTGHEPEHPDIIYRPDRQPPGKRALFSGITFVAWLIWFYLFLPLISLLAWMFGLISFQEYMLDPERSGYLFTLTTYAIVVAVTALVILAWSRYNKIRFGGPDRRKPVLPVSDEMVQQRFGLDAETLRKARSAKVLEVDLGPGGSLRSARLRGQPRADAEREEIWTRDIDRS